MAGKNGNGNERVSREDLKTADTEHLCDELVTRIEFRPGERAADFKREIMRRSGYEHADSWTPPPAPGKGEKTRRERRVVRDDYGHVIETGDEEDDIEDE